MKAFRRTVRTAAKPARAIARRTFNTSARVAAASNPMTAQLVSDYEKELARQRRITARAQQGAPALRSSAYQESDMKEAGNFRKMTTAPVTVGMQIKRPPISSRETGKYDSKVVSASEVIFSGVTSTSGGWTGNTATSMFLNPLHPALRILADEAKNFQLYRFIKATVVFESTCNSSTSGALVLGQLSDVLEPPPTNYDDAALLKDTIQANVWQSCALPLDLDPSFRFVSSGAGSTTDAEVRQTNQAKIFYGIVNCPLSTLIGNIKLEYTVELSKRVNGTELTSFDEYGYLIPASAPLQALLPIVSGARGSSWFTKDIANQFLILGPRATYIVNFALLSSIDEDAVSVGSSFKPKNPDGTLISIGSPWAYGGYSDVLFSNQNMYVCFMTFKTTEMYSYLDFSVLSDLTGPIDFNITIDILT